MSGEAETAETNFTITLCQLVAPTTTIGSISIGGVPLTLPLDLTIDPIVINTAEVSDTFSAEIVLNNA